MSFLYVSVVAFVLCMPFYKCRSVSILYIFFCLLYWYSICWFTLCILYLFIIMHINMVPDCVKKKTSKIQYKLLVLRSTSAFSMYLLVSACVADDTNAIWCVYVWRFFFVVLFDYSLHLNLNIIVYSCSISLSVLYVFCVFSDIFVFKSVVFLI